MSTLMQKIEEDFEETTYRGKINHEIVEIVCREHYRYGRYEDCRYDSYDNSEKFIIKKYPAQGEKAYTVWKRFKRAFVYDVFSEVSSFSFFAIVWTVVVGVPTIVAPVFMITFFWSPAILLAFLAFMTKKTHDKFIDSKTLSSSYRIGLDRSSRNENERTLISDKIEMFTVESLSELYDALAEKKKAKILLNKAQKAMFELDADDVMVPAVKAKIQEREEDLEEADMKVESAFDNANHICSDNLRKEKDEKLMQILMED